MWSSDMSFIYPACSGLGQYHPYQICPVAEEGAVKFICIIFIS